MSRDDPEVRLRHMLDYARKAVAIMRGHSRADLDRDEALSLALLRAVEIIGEAASRIPAAVRARYPNIPWLQIVGTRNRLIHGYDIVDYDIVWLTVTNDLPPLIAEWEKIVPPGTTA